MEKKNSFEKSFIGWLNLGWQIWGFLDMFFFDKFGPSDPLQSAWDLSHFVLELRSSHMFEVSSEKKKTLVFTCPINRHIAKREKLGYYGILPQHQSTKVGDTTGLGSMCFIRISEKLLHIIGFPAPRRCENSKRYDGTTELFQTQTGCWFQIWFEMVSYSILHSISPYYQIWVYHHGYGPLLGLKFQNLRWSRWCQNRPVWMALRLIHISRISKRLMTPNLSATWMPRLTFGRCPDVLMMYEMV